MGGHLMQKKVTNGLAEGPGGLVSVASDLNCVD